MPCFFKSETLVNWNYDAHLKISIIKNCKLMWPPPHTPANMFNVISTLPSNASPDCSLYKSWRPAGSPFHSSTRALTFLAIQVGTCRMVVSRLVLGVASPRAMWERLYPGCYSFISALWEKRQHPYLLRLIWKRHTWGLSTRSERIWWQVKGSPQLTLIFFLFWSAAPFWPNV